MNLYEHLSAVWVPERTVIREESGRVWTYGELDALAGRMASALATLGVAPGNRVAAQLEKSVPAGALYLACLRLGAIFLPLNPAYTDAELDFLLGDAEPVLFVGTGARLPQLASLLRRHRVPHSHSLDPDGGSLLAASANLEPRAEIADCTGGDTAVLLYTSGTTGRPKGAMLSHGNLLANAQALYRAWGWRQEDVLLHALPMFHIHGLLVAFQGALLAGAEMIFHRRFDPAPVIRDLARATLFMGVPTFYTRLLRHEGFTREACAPIRLFVSGSAPLLERTFDEFAARIGQPILERYGMTETGMICSNPLDGPRKPGSVGPALAGEEVRIVDENGREVPRGEIGAIEVRGPNVLTGYWKRPRSLEFGFREDGFFVTGDLGRFDEDGYLWILGRAKDVIITGGLNVYAKEIEDWIDAFSGVRESAVIGLPHEDFGEAVTAIVCREPGASAPDEAGILQDARTHLADFKRPKRVLFVEDLPRNSMGKVEKARLRRDHAALYERVPSGGDE